MIKLNGVEIKPTMFPDKTSQIWKVPSDLLGWKFSQIEWKFENESELMQVAQLKDLLSIAGTEVDLVLPYLPYGRQDKEISNDKTFALNTFAKLINSLEFKVVMVTDAHSWQAERLIKNFQGVSTAHEVAYTFNSTESQLICYPDKGALDKYTKLFSYVHVYGEKERDQTTGQIFNYELFGDVKDKKVLIVDDICDGGATFIFLTRKLLFAGAKEVNLFVSHGIFSKGLDVLREEGIKRIFTKDGEVK